MSEQDSNVRGRGYFIPKEIVHPSVFRLDGQKKTDADLKLAISQLESYVAKYRAHFLGYQSTAQLNTKHLASFVSSAINNIGDSFANPEVPEGELRDGYFSLNSKWVEREVLDYLARLWKAPSPRWVRQDLRSDWLDTYWGYVLSMGSTEGNLMAIRSARDYLKGRILLYDDAKSPGIMDLHYEEREGVETYDSRFDPVILYSTASHYSVRKLAQILEVEERRIKSDEHGQMDPVHLEEVARKTLLEDKRPIMVVFNYGTTWTGALDNVEKLTKMLLPIIKQAGFYHREVPNHGFRKGYWLHVDGALGAGYGSYVDADPSTGAPLPRFDFSLDIQSIVVSGHKWPGAPWPTGVYMTLNKYLLTNDVPQVVGSMDSTLAGSRSGIAPIYLWDWIARSSDEDRKKEGEAQLRLAEYALTRIKAVWDKDATRAPGSIMVVFKAPPASTVRQFALATSDGRSHLVCMRHVKPPLVERLIKTLQELKAEPAPLDAALFEPEDRGREGW